MSGETNLSDSVVSNKQETESIMANDTEVESQIHARSRRSFLGGGLVVVSGFLGWRWLISRRDDQGIGWFFRRSLELNEQISRDYFQQARLAPTFPRTLAKEPRVNGGEGMSEDFEPNDWQLTLTGAYDQTEPLMITLADIKKLPRVEMVTELKCIEGWSEVVHWGGARLADFIAKYPPITHSGDAPDVQNKPNDLVEYLGMETPDGGYYIGLEMASALHPQTLLCYEMNGKPLELDHGAPLRLVIPVKYGIKSIKRIGAITYANQRPADYWAERGYDWYAGH